MSIKQIYYTGIWLGKMIDIKNLIDRLNTYRNSYYNNNVSLISDREYDALYDQLVKLEEKTGIILSNSPTQSVGYTVASKLKKVKHNHPLLSLNKTTEEKNFLDYFDGKKFIMMAKLDGLTCSLTYKDGRLIRAETRGDGETGEDITQNAKMFSNLPLSIPYKGELTVDGECIITFDEFDRINEREQTEYKNPRNLVSGTVRQLNNKVVRDRNIMFIAWKLHSAPADSEYLFMTSRFHFDMDSQNDRLLFLSELGFDVVYTSMMDSNSNLDILKSSISHLQWRCEEHKIPIDGIVGMFDSISYGESLGRTGHHPRHSLAFKFYQEENETILKDIEWATSRTGLVNPVAVFEPVEIDGTTVTRATLNNVSIIKELEIGIGDTVTVIKANQIIPKITQNLTRSNTYQIPKVCPSCGLPTVIKNDNGREMLYCTNRHCKAIVHDKISNFATREAMNIVGISEERLRYLMDMGYITDFASLYSLKEHRDEIAQAKGFGKSSVDNLVNAIEESRKTKLQNVIVAIGIPGIGKSAARNIAKHCMIYRAERCHLNSDENKSPLQIFIDLVVNDYDWSVLSEMGAATSEAINQYVMDNLADIQPLVDILYIDYTSEEETSSQKLANKTFCITGKLIKFANRNALVKEIESNGGKVVSSVTAKTQYLITNDKTSGSSKNKAAEKYGTKIISEDEFIAGTL